MSMLLLAVLCLKAETINTHSHVTKILQDRTGMMWFATWNGLVRYDGTHQTIFKPKAGDGSGITSDRMRNIVLNDDGNILCRVDEEACLFNIVTCTFTRLPDKEREKAMKMLQSAAPKPKNTAAGDASDDVKRRFTDRQGNLWLMYENKIEHQPIIKRHGTPAEWLRGDVVRAIFRDRSGRIWITGRDRKQVAVFDKALHLLGYLGTDGRLHPDVVPFASVYSVFQTTDGNIWLGAKPDGIYRLKASQQDGVEGKPHFIVEHLKSPSLRVEAPYSFAQDKKGRLWVASNRDGLICIDNPDVSDFGQMRAVSLAKTVKSYPADAMRMRHLHLENDGTLLATTTNGLLVVDNIYKPLSQLTMRLHTREADNSASLSSGALMSIVNATGPGVLIGTESGGVNQFVGDNIHASKLSFHHFTQSEGLLMDVAQGLMMLADGRLLVQCSYGISVIDLKTGNIDNYGMNFWNTTAEFSDCNPLMLDDGRLLFGMTDGLLLLPFSQMSQNGYKPRIALTALTINDMPTDYAIDSKDTITLTSSQRSMTLAFAALDYRAAESLLYRYRMSADEAWSNPLPTNELVLQDLSPGTYQLQICSSNADDQWTDNVRTLTIIVQPKFFEAWYGILFLLLLGIGIVSAVTYTLFYIRNLNRERNQTLEAYLQLLDERDKERTKAEEQSAATGVMVEPAEPVIVSNLSDDDEAFMDRLMAFVEQNIGNSDANVNDMAEATATSRSGLSRRMHSLFGVTPADFLREARLKRAAQMLTDTRKTNSEIAYACGFSDPKYFAKTFKAKYGKSPREYREEVK